MGNIVLQHNQNKNIQKLHFMRKLLNSLIMLVFCIMATLASFAQEPAESTPKPRWISDKGYWIIESNLKTPKTAIIHFYNNDNTKIYSEKVEGVELNIKKRKTLMMLKKALDESLVAFEATKHAKQDSDLVKNILKR